MAPAPLDYLLVGGGLQNGLLALALAARRPDARVVLVERGDRVGGNHTWSFHAGDISPEMADVVAPLVEAHWPRYEVRFPGWRREVDRPYATIPSARLDAAVRRALDRPGAALLLEADVAEVSARGARLRDGRELAARLVVDARGPGEHPPGRCGWQKFLGLELELPRPSAPPLPLLMDADLPQDEGFRFLYVLPLAPTRVLVEDTVFADDAALDPVAWRARILALAAARGWGDGRVVREERGALPLPLDEPPADDPDGPLRAGYAGGWFHPTTGYSFPVAARLAWRLADDGPDAPAQPGWPAFVRAHRRQAAFARLLNRLLFCAVPPAQRWHVLRRFYGLPVGTIERFYALALTGADRARILGGRPPRGLTLRAAVAALRGR